MASSDAPHLLLFEPDARGHALEWVEHLLGYAVQLGQPLTLSVLVPPALADSLNGWTHGTRPVQISMLPLTPRELALCNSSHLSVSGLARWWVMRQRVRACGADHGLFLGLDHLSLPLALGLGGGGAGLSGVLFRPSVHYDTDPESPPRLGERLRDLRKALLYPMMLRNPALQTAWSLDPYFPAWAADRYKHGHKVRPAPDPAFPIPGPAEREVTRYGRLSHIVPSDRTLFVIFGALSERKGLLVLMDALRRLEPRFARGVAVIAAGQVDPALHGRLKTALEELQEMRPEIWMRLDTRRLPSAEIAALVSAADVILAPYQRFVGSSGVMLWAASAGKPVITQSYGLLGRLARDHGLGLDVDTSDPSDIASAIVKVLLNGAGSLGDPEGMARFAKIHASEVFAARLVEGCTGLAEPLEFAA